MNCAIKTDIIEKNVFLLEKLNIKIKSYEFIFLDPPFKEHRINILLKAIKNKKILKKDGIILLHREKKILDKFPKDFKILITRQYGRSKIIFGKFD